MLVSKSLLLYHLGLIRCLLCTKYDSDVSHILTDAAEFFNNFFSHTISWKKDLVVRKRVA